jgi:peroxiredoxin
MTQYATRSVPAVLVLAGALLAAACGGGGDAVPRERFADPPAAGADGGLAPNFTAKNLHGQTVNLTDWAGKVRLVDFWATWCAPCREEIPMLNALHEEFGERGLVILAMSDEDASVIQRFVESHDVAYTNLTAPAEVSESYGVLGLPSAYLIDRDGKIVATMVGPKSADDLRQRIAALVDGTPAT